MLQAKLNFRVLVNLWTELYLITIILCLFLGYVLIQTYMFNFKVLVKTYGQNNVLGCYLMSLSRLGVDSNVYVTG